MKMRLPHYYQAVFYIIAGLIYASPVSANPLNLAVANSTCSAIKSVGKLFEQQNGITLNYLCKSSGRLAKGLNGSTITADIYISANRKWMDYMINNNLIQASYVISPWGNELVVATRKESSLELNDWHELTTDKVKSILIGDPGTAPFGRYAKQAMQSTGIWSKVKSKITTKKHITLLAETLSESDPNTVGILFGSNVNESHRVLFPVNQSWHPTIRYYLAPVEDAVNNNNVKALLDFIVGSEAKEIFREANFQVEAE